MLDKYSATLATALPTQSLSKDLYLFSCLQVYMGYFDLEPVVHWNGTSLEDCALYNCVGLSSDVKEASDFLQSIYYLFAIHLFRSS